MWFNQQIFTSRRHVLSMEGGRRVSSIEDLPPQILDTGVDQLPGQLLENLGLQLFNEGRGVAGNWEGVAEEIGINTTRELEQIRRHALVEHMFPGRLMLRDWGKKSGSTVFVLLNALRRQGREDCIDLVIKACKDVHSMQLHVKIEDSNGQHRYLSVTTKKDATLAASLENVLSGLPSYIITGPDHKITWQTPACHLKGTQLSLKKGEATEESVRNVYGIVQQKSHVQPPTEDNCLQNSYNPYTSQSIPVPLNIPVTEPPSTSNNFISRTEPKIQEPHVSLPITYNDLSKQGPCQRLLPSQDFPSLSSSSQFFTNSFISHIPSQAERQTLLKKPSYSVDESISHSGNLTSVTAPKHCFSNFSQFRAGSLDEQEHDTLMKRCDPLRHSESHVRHALKQSDYVPHTHPMINFSNQILNQGKQGVMSSPIQCRRPMPRAKNEDYVSPESLHSITGSPASLCKPKPCIKHSIHVSSDNMSPPCSTPPKPTVKPKPMPCVLQQRKDGYIDIFAQGPGGRVVHGSQDGVSTQVLRQQSVPEASPMSVDCSEGQGRERANSVPEEISKAAPPGCVVSRDGNGYATFAGTNSLMEVDLEEGSGGSVMLPYPVYIDTDADGYLSTSGASDSAANSMESAMEGESSGGSQTRGGPLVIQQSGDGYFGFGSANSSTSPPQMMHGSAPQACAPTEYVDMSRSMSLPNMPAPVRNPDGLIYARFSEEDEEEDADYFDMKQLPNADRNKQMPNVNRHWSEGDIESLNVVPTSSQYDYINESEQTPPRSLPPRPSHPVPMKRRRFRSQDPEHQTQSDSRQTVDLDTVPGWCRNETEDSISGTMKRYQQEDGNFIVWWMERKKRYVVTVSHMNDLRHYAVYERRQGAKVRLFIFGGGEEFDSLKSLVEYYMREGLKGPELPTGHSRGKRWQQFSHVRLRKPLKVKYTHTVVRKKAT